MRPIWTVKNLTESQKCILSLICNSTKTLVTQFVCFIPYLRHFEQHFYHSEVNHFVKSLIVFNCYKILQWFSFSVFISHRFQLAKIIKIHLWPLNRESSWYLFEISLKIYGCMLNIKNQIMPIKISRNTNKKFQNTTAIWQFSINSSEKFGKIN